MFKQENILELMNEQLQSDEIKVYVANKVKDTIKKSIDNQFKDWGDYGESYITINQAIKEAIGLNLKDMKIPEFQAMLINTLNESLLSTIQNEAKQNLEENMKRLLITDKKEYSLKEFIFEFMEDKRIVSKYQEENDDEFYGCSMDATITYEDLEFENLLSSNIVDLELKIDANKRWIDIGIQEKTKNGNNYSKDYELRLYKGISDKEYSVSWMRIAGKELNNVSLFSDKPRWFDGLMFQLYSKSTKIVITDEDLKYFEEK